MANTSLKSQFDRFKMRLKQKVLDAGHILEGEMHDLVAIDTGKLDRSIVTDQVADRGNLISVDVGSEKVPYAVFVDQGVKGRVYRYHRREGANRPIVWIGVGQHFMERALENKMGEIKSKIIEASIA